MGGWSPISAPFQGIILPSAQILKILSVSLGRSGKQGITDIEKRGTRENVKKSAIVRFWKGIAQIVCRGRQKVGRKLYFESVGGEKWGILTDPFPAGAGNVIL